GSTTSSLSKARSQNHDGPRAGTATRPNAAFPKLAKIFARFFHGAPMRRWLRRVTRPVPSSVSPVCWHTFLQLGETSHCESDGWRYQLTGEPFFRVVACVSIGQRVRS